MKNRPTSATTIALVLIVVGGLNLVSAFLVGSMDSVISPEMTETLPDLSNASFTNRAIVAVVTHPWILPLVQVIVALAAIISGIGLFVMRPWGRALSEALTWLVLLFLAGFTVLWVSGPAGALLSLGSGSGSSWFLIVLIVFGLGFALVLSIPLIAALVALRGNEIRAAVRAGSGQRVSPN